MAEETFIQQQAIISFLLKIFIIFLKNEKKVHSIKREVFFILRKNKGKVTLKSRQGQNTEKS